MENPFYIVLFTVGGSPISPEASGFTGKSGLVYIKALIWPTLKQSFNGPFILRFQLVNRIAALHAYEKCKPSKILSEYPAQFAGGKYFGEIS